MGYITNFPPYTLETAIYFDENIVLAYDTKTLFLFTKPITVRHIKTVIAFKRRKCVKHYSKTKQ